MFRALTYQLLRAWHAILSGPRALLQLIVAPLKWIGQLFGRIVEWWSSRESKYLLRGIPSIVVFALAAYLLVACRLRSGTALADRYLTAAQRLNDPEAAALLYERVVSLRPNDDATLFELARQSIDAGDQTRAQVILQKLAPPEGQGYAPAQLFVGRHYLARQHLSNDYFKLAERHLTNALSLAPRDPRTNASLGMLYFRRGVWDLAVRHFEDALDPRYHDGGETDDNLHPIRLSLAKAYSFQGQLAKAESLARQAREHFAGRVEDNPREDIAARRYLAEACMFLEDFETASEVLQMGLALNEGDASLRSALARFNVAWSDAVLHTGEGTREQRFELLSTALLLDPNYAPIFDRMMNILAEDDPTAASAREFLMSNVTSGRSIGLSHLLLGSAAFQTEDSDSAAYHLERAFDSLPNAPIVANNLAWFLAFSDPPDLSRGMDLINTVLDENPDDPRFLDTRGQIYTKLERWDEAIDDLERGLHQQNPGPETHAALAKCYEAKGLSDLALRHRQLANPALGQ